ncbi:hypothetical protein Tco_0075983, partial [Tanacetum coccineum]
EVKVEEEIIEAKKKLSLSICFFVTMVAHSKVCRSSSSSKVSVRVTGRDGLRCHRGRSTKRMGAYHSPRFYGQRVA